MAGSHATFESAARSFAGLVHRIPGDAWDGPGLGDWDLRSLVGHASRSLITVSTYLQTPAEREDVATPQEYYARIRAVASNAGADAIVERGRQAGRDLGADPAPPSTISLSACWASWPEAGTRSSRSSAGSASGCTHTCRPGRSSSRCTAWISHGQRVFRSPCPRMCWTRPQCWRPGSRVATGDGETVLLSLTGRAALPPSFSVV